MLLCYCCDSAGATAVLQLCYYCYCSATAATAVLLLLLVLSLLCCATAISTAATAVLLLLLLCYYCYCCAITTAAVLVRLYTEGTGQRSLRLPSMAGRGQRNNLLWVSALAVGVTAAALLAYSVVRSQKSVVQKSAAEEETGASNAVEGGRIMCSHDMHVIISQMKR